MGNVYQIITDRIVGLLEKGTIPWHQPWGDPDRYPKNLISGKEYRGINVFLLSSAGYESPWWLTYKQARARGGNVKKGEHGWPCVYWNWHPKIDAETLEIRKIPFLRYYTLFNVEQTEGIQCPRLEKRVQEFTPLEACEHVVEGMPNRPRIEHKGDSAYYDCLSDFIQIPCREQFESSEGYYSTLFHEMSHSTGHSSRLARPEILKPGAMGSQSYSREELVAEMGAAFLCGHCGIGNETVDNSASYVASWLSRLRNDPRLVIQAAGQAQKASDYILHRMKGGDEDEMLNLQERATGRDECL